MATYAALTDHERLYRDTYWGNFRAAHTTPSGRREGRDPSTSTLEHRNAFAAKVRRATSIPQYAYKAAFPERWANGRLSDRPAHEDHVEIYASEGGWVVVTSPYKGRFDGELPGWTVIPPIYHPDATSYACRVLKAGRKRVAL